MAASDSMGLDHSRAPTDHINIRMLHNVISGIPFTMSLEPESEVLMLIYIYVLLFYSPKFRRTHHHDSAF